MTARFVTAAILAILTAGAVPAAASERGVGALAAYRGTWRVRIVHYRTKYSRPRVETSTVRNDCWRSGDYVACHQYVDDRSAALVAYTYDRRTDVYHTHVVLPGAAPAPVGLLKIAGDTWTYPWKDRDPRGKPIFLRIVNRFRSADTIDYREEYSSDERVWIKTADGVERRLAAR